MPEYKVVIDQNEYLVAEEVASQLDVIQIDQGTLHVLDYPHGLLVKILNVEDGGKSQILEVDGKKYEIRISDEQDVLIQNLGFNKKKNQVLNLIKAPMPGLVLDIIVEIDQVVQKGDPLLVLEAMKMENLIKAPSQGIVKKIYIKKGSPITKGQLMLEIS